ncbi:MAG TPA: glycoside hydrolase family 2 TIM barrel-domain containing protein, partial [Neobacillus sp.]
MTVRNEYPRPQVVRSNWENLNGVWDFCYDDDNLGLEEKWYQGNKEFDRQIQVPFVYQAKASGIGDVSAHDIVWYKNQIEVTKKQGKRTILHFGAVDYLADVFVNGEHVCQHEGGHTSFEVDITDNLVAQEKQLIVVRVFDPQKDESIPRGKQFWEDESRGIWYTNTTGIWQTVWLEEVSETYVQKLRLTPLFDAGKVEIEAVLNNILPAGILEFEISFKDQLIAKGTQELIGKKCVFDVELLQERIFRYNFHDDGISWTPENPNLFDLKIAIVSQDETIDSISSYFGLRKIHIENGMVYLNNKPYYQKLVLDQGYWPEGLLTAPSDEDFIKDIQLAQDMGFNGCRKHQKTEDPRFLYWADQMGFLVWGECASAPIYNNQAVNRLLKEWAEIIDRDYNHPCIVTWVPLNESWGVPNIHFDRQQQHFSQTMYHYIHSIDTTRLVISNDGWDATETDICAIHNYSHGSKSEKQKYQFFKETLRTKEKIIYHPSTSRDIYAQGFENKGEPILLTEFGGIGFDVSGQPGWGYTSVENVEEYLEDYRRIMEAVFASEILWGYCYTQLTDVEQEINGILTYDRQPKCDLNKIKELNNLFHLS